MQTLLFLCFLLLGSFSSFAQVKKVGIGLIPEDEAFGFALAPDKSSAYFVRSYSGRDTLIIYEMKKKQGRWQTPVIAPFTSKNGEWKDIDPFITLDGQQLFFQSNRPVQQGGHVKKDFDIWVMNREGNGWGGPRHLGFTVNSDTSDSFLSTTAAGKLYFGSMRAGGFGAMDVYAAEPHGKEWRKPVNVGSQINSSDHDTNPFISHDESFLILTKRSKRENKDSDLHISFNVNGKWTQPWNLGPGINSDLNEFCPFMLPGEDTLYFARLERKERFKENIFMAHLPIDRFKKLIKINPEVSKEYIVEDNSDTTSLATKRYKIFAAKQIEGFGGFDLYISYNENGTWSSPINMGPSINSTHDDLAPSQSTDKKSIYFKRRLANAEFEEQIMQMCSSFLKK